MLSSGTLVLDDTIAAIASAAGGAARAVVRLSGSAVIAILEQCFHAEETSRRPTSFQQDCVIPGQISWAGMPQIPADVFLWPTPRSYTRQPLAEIHTIGSPPLVDGVLRTVCAAGARLAQPGEFTLRAFLAGRIDLTQAEAVLGVVDAADRRQLDVALVQLAGGLARPLHELRASLLDLLADLEAGLDFVEEDIRFVSHNELDSRLAVAADQIEQLARQLAARGLSGRLPRVVLAGRPNVGKSSLFNALVRQSAAMVSPQPGTTRDYLTATIDAAGLAVELVDTAGIAGAPGLQAIDSVAQSAAAQQHQHADLRLLCLESAGALTAWEGEQKTLAGTLLVQTKCDEAVGSEISPRAIATSSRTGVGLDRLRTAIREALVAQAGESHAVAATVARSRQSIRLAADSMTAARSLVAASAGDELIAAELRTALDELGKIAGAVYTDDLLDRIFSRFCIGK